MRRCYLVLYLFIVLMSLQVNSATAQSWSVPLNLGPVVNSTYVEDSVSISKNGLSLYITSNRPCGAMDLTLDRNIWVAKRESKDAEWTSPVCLDINLDIDHDGFPSFSRDEHWMFFSSTRPGGVPGAFAQDIWISWRADVHDENGWTAPINAGSILNSGFAEAQSTYFANEEFGNHELIFASARNGFFDLFVSEILGPGIFGVPTQIAELNSATSDFSPSVRFDGLEIFFTRGVLTGTDIWSARRTTPDSVWSPPENLGSPISLPGVRDFAAHISSDRRTLYLISDRIGTQGGLDIWVSVRPKEDIN